MQGVGHAREAGRFEVDDEILPFGGDDRVRAVRQHKVREARRVELGVFRMPVHDELVLFAAFRALDADGQVFAVGNAVQTPHVNSFTPVRHPVGGMGVVVVFAVVVFRVIRLGAHVELQRAVLILCAQVRPVVPPEVHAVGRKLWFGIRVTVVKVVPQVGFAFSERNGCHREHHRQGKQESKELLHGDTSFMMLTGG